MNTVGLLLCCVVYKLLFR